MLEMRLPNFAHRRETALAGAPGGLKGVLTRILLSKSERLKAPWDLEIWAWIRAKKMDSNGYERGGRYEFQLPLRY